MILTDYLGMGQLQYVAGCSSGGVISRSVFAIVIIPIGSYY